VVVVVVVVRGWARRRWGVVVDEDVKERNEKLEGRSFFSFDEREKVEERERFRKFRSFEKRH